MGTGQTLQEGGWLDFYAMTPLHVATVPGDGITIRWKDMVGLLCIKVSLLGLDTVDSIPLQLN